MGGFVGLWLKGEVEVGGKTYHAFDSTPKIVAFLLNQVHDLIFTVMVLSLTNMLVRFVSHGGTMSQVWLGLAVTAVMRGALLSFAILKLNVTIMPLIATTQHILGLIPSFVVYFVTLVTQFFASWIAGFMWQQYFNRSTPTSMMCPLGDMEDGDTHDLMTSYVTLTFFAFFMLSVAYGYTGLDANKGGHSDNAFWGMTLVFALGNFVTYGVNPTGTANYQGMPFNFDPNWMGCLGQSITSMILRPDDEASEWNNHFFIRVAADITALLLQTFCFKYFGPLRASAGHFNYAAHRRLNAAMQAVNFMKAEKIKDASGEDKNDMNGYGQNNMSADDMAMLGGSSGADSKAEGDTAA